MPLIIVNVPSEIFDSLLRVSKATRSFAMLPSREQTFEGYAVASARGLSNVAYAFLPRCLRLVVAFRFVY